METPEGAGLSLLDALPTLAEAAARLVAIRKSEPATGHSRKKALRELTKKHVAAVDVRTLELAGYFFVLTRRPPDVSAESGNHGTRDALPCRRMDEEPASFREALRVWKRHYAAVPRPDAIYHYTSLDAVIGIFGSRLLRCSNARFSNDPAEISYSYAMLRERVAAVLPQIPLDDLFAVMEQTDYYAACFSAAVDSLPQWRAYCGNGRGVAIGFNPEVFEKHRHLTFGRVEYEPDRQQDLIDRMLQIFLPRLRRCASKIEIAREILPQLAECLAVVAGLLKDHSYESEREYRAFTWQLRSPDEQLYPVRFRATPSAIVPYLEFDYTSLDVKPIVTDVLIGPCLDPTITQPSLEAFFQQTFASPPVVRRSTVRMRG